MSAFTPIQTLLGCILGDFLGRGHKLLKILQDNFHEPKELPFADETTVAIFKVLYSSPCDYSTFAVRTSGQFNDSVGPFVEASKGTNGESALYEVLRERDKQQLLKISIRAQTDLLSGVDPVKVRQTIADESSKISPAATSPDWSEHILISQGDMQAMAERGVELDSGLVELDAIYLWRRKNVTIVAAPTSHGKTAFALWMTRRALKAMRPLRVAYLAFEDYNTIPMKLASQAFGIPLDCFTRYFAQQPDIKAKVDDAMMLARQWAGQIKVFPAISLSQFESELESFRPDVIVFDYLQRYIERYTGSRDSKREAIGKAADYFHRIVEKFNAFGLMCSQISRRENTKGGAGPPRRPQIYDLKESGDLENYADGVILLWRPAKENPQILERNDFYIEVAKDKVGKCGDVKVLFHGETQTFSDMFGSY